MMNSKNLLICLPILALLGCGDHKKEKSVPVAPVATQVSDSTVKADSQVTLGTENPLLPSSTSVNTTVPVTNGEGKGTTPTVPVTPTVPATPTGKEPNQSEPAKGDSGKGPGKDETVPADCDIKVLDFDKKPDGAGFGLGEKIREQYRAYGVRIEGYSRDQANSSYDTMALGEAIIFNSAQSPDEATKQKYAEVAGNKNSGFDEDLLTSTQKNVLIIAEHLFDINPKDNIDWVTYPDDNTFGGKIKLFFDKPTRVLDMDFVATESDSSRIELWTTGNANATASQSMPKLSPNQVQKLTVANNSFVNKLKIIMGAGGAVDNIRICVKK